MPSARAFPMGPGRVVLVVATLAVAATTSFAFVGPAAVAAGPESDATVTSGILAELAADPAKARLADDAIARSKTATADAARLRAKGDEAHAKMAEGVAREWAELGRELVEVAALEEKANRTQEAARDAGARVERERALVEEGIARTGRLRTQLESLEKEHPSDPKPPETKKPESKPPETKKAEPKKAGAR
ncbi:MAG: hypothetical protein U0169_27690 [Polyangiaceae bacterium]